MTENQSPDLSPWIHPKAKRWFHSLFEDNTFPLALEDELIKAESQQDFQKIRMIVALAIFFGKEATWPENRKTILRAIARAAGKITKTGGNASAPLTIAQHRGKTSDDQELQHELEILRRRLNLSNRKGKLEPPNWGRLWE